jgi:hypothetical protein
MILLVGQRKTSKSSATWNQAYLRSLSPNILHQYAFRLVDGQAINHVKEQAEIRSFFRESKAHRASAQAHTTSDVSKGFSRCKPQADAMKYYFSTLQFYCKAVQARRSMLLLMHIHGLIFTMFIVN